LLVFAMNRFNMLFVVADSWIAGRSRWLINICEVSESK
jgi:hypothetical protein